MADAKTFPILGDQAVKRVPWSLVEPYRAKAAEIHGQTLEGLASRGGLSPLELWGIAHGINVFRINARDLGGPTAKAREWLQAALAGMGGRDANQA